MNLVKITDLTNQLKVLQDKGRRSKIVAKLRQFADVTGEIVRSLNNNL